MINAGSIIGALMEGGLNNAGSGRLQNALGPGGLGGQSGIGDLLGGLLGGGGSGSGGGGGGLAGMLGGVLGGSQGGGAGGGLGSMLGGVLGGGQGGNAGGQQGGGIGGMLGGLLGGGSGGAGGLAGGGAMAVLGMLAMNALKGHGGGSPSGNSGMQLMAGLREPESEEEQQQVQGIAMLIVRAMINAAKADGEVDQEELEKIVGRLKKSGAEESDLAYVRERLAGPMETDAIVAEVNDPQVAAQLYTASLLAISVDTTAEQQYIAALGDRLNLPQEARQQIHSMLGM